MPLPRRRVLGVVAGGSLLSLSGCQSGGNTTTSPTATPATCDITEERRITIEETASDPPDIAITLTAQMDRERVTADGPARLQVTLTNRGSPFETTVQAGRRCHLFDRYHGRSDPEGLWLYHHKDPPLDHDASCWTEKEVPSRTRTFSMYGCPRQTIASQATLTTTLVVWDDYSTADYYPPGSYRFTREIPIWRKGTETESTQQDHPDRIVDWWFDLQVTERES